VEESASISNAGQAQVFSSRRYANVVNREIEMTNVVKAMEYAAQLEREAIKDGTSKISLAFDKEYNTPAMTNLERLIRIMDKFDLVTCHAESMEDALDALESELRDVLGHYREQRKWVPLTADEATAIWEGTDDRDSWELIMRVQKALKEKNSG
jgi:hypothetical protein